MSSSVQGVSRRRSRAKKAAPKKRDHAAIAAAFARDVLDGTFPAGRLLRAAVKRQVEDLKRTPSADFPFRFDPEVGAKACRFLELLPHVEGPKTGTRVQLEGWQVWGVFTLNGWVHTVTGYPRFRRATMFMPKGQGKTFLGAGMALDPLARGKLGEKVYSAATTRDQAGLSFQTARMMLNLAPDVRDHFGLVVEQHQIVRPESGSHFKPISSEANSAEGKIPAFILEDEIHAHKTRELHDNLRSMAAKLPYSRQVVISTAGFDMSPQAIGWEVYCYARDILLGAVKDDSQFALLIEADRVHEDGTAVDPWKPETWRQANPNLGVSIDEVEVANEANEARQVPSKQASFFTKRLGWWVQAANAFIGDLSKWDALADPSLRLEDFAGEQAFIGGDLGSTLDLTAKVVVFARDHEDGKRHYYVFSRCFLAEDSATLRDGNDTLRVWADQGHLVLTPGPAMDVGIVLDALVGDLEAFPGSEVCLDPWGAIALVQGLNSAGYENQVVQIRQGAKTQSPAMKELEAAVLTGRLHHTGDPVLRWCIGNLVGRTDRNGNVAPDRESDGKKIDAAVALINALVRAMLGTESAYSGGQGLREL